MNMEDFIEILENEEKTKVFFHLKKEVPADFYKYCDLNCLVQFLRNKKYFHRVIRPNLIKIIYSKFNIHKTLVVRGDLKLFQRVEFSFPPFTQWESFENKKKFSVNIQENDLIMKVKVTKEKIESRDVNGRKINLDKFNIDDFLGDNVEASEVNGVYELKSLKSGLLVMDYDLISVYPPLTIDGDVTVNTGNVYTNGDLTITGDVYSSLKVRAGGKITIKGVVEGADIYCENDVVVEKNITGFKKAKVIARGNIVVNSAHSCHIIADGDIHVKRLMSQCQCYCLGVFNMPEEGKLTGGLVSAKKGAVFGEIGSQEAITTEILTGVDPLLLSTLEKQKMRMRTIDREMNLIRKNIEYLYKKDYDFPEYDEPVFYSCYLHDSISEKNNIDEQCFMKLSRQFFLLQLHKEEKDRLKKKIRIVKKSIFPEDVVVIDVLNRIHPAVSLRIKNHYLRIEEESGRGRFVLTEKGIEKREMEGGHVQ